MESYFFYYLLGLLILFSVATNQGLKILQKRNTSDWIIDSLSLINHFVILPIIQAALVYPLLSFLFPSLKDAIELGWTPSLIVTMLIDYAWYWNHRLFHAKTKFWSLHAVHHEPHELDIFKTPRNTLWSPLFMTYFWLIPLFVFLAKDPGPFLFMSALSLLINFWGHTHLNFPKNSLARKIASTFLIQPKDHYWHHSSNQTYCNFATVFNFWDRLHGTWHNSEEVPESLGFKVSYSLPRKIFFPKSE